MKLLYKLGNYIVNLYYDIRYRFEVTNKMKRIFKLIKEQGGDLSHLLEIEYMLNKLIEEKSREVSKNNMEQLRKSAKLFFETLYE